MREKIYHKCIPVCFPDQFIEHGLPGEIYEKYGLDGASVAKKINDIMNGERREK